MMLCRSPSVFVLLLLALGTTSAQEVVVNSGDLAVGRTFTATSTCGQDGPEVYCDLFDPADEPEQGSNGGRSCFTCDSSEPDNSHPATFLTDTDSSATEDRTWWQAGNGVSNVTLELELEALFLFTQLIVTFRSPRPAGAVVERSRDFGETYEPYQYYSDDCMGDFGLPDQSSVRTVDEVICTSEYSNIEPFTNGELTYRPLPPSLGLRDYNAPAVINKTTLTNLRIRLLRLNTLPGDDLSDPFTAMSYQYAVYSIVVRGWCFCNGHALACDPLPDATQMEPGMVNSECRCGGNTQGDSCEQCLPLFNDRPWLPANGPNQTSDTARYCQECQCYGRASSCHFDPQVAMDTGGSGGVCDNCTHNTAGRNCQLCVAGFYRNTSALFSDPNMCIPCQCDLAGSTNNGICFPDDDPVDLRIISGSCECRANVEGERCDRCKPGFFNFTADNPAGCQPCGCDVTGSEVTECHMTTGECTCKSHVTGHTCDMCEPGYCCMGPDGCRACECDPGGSLNPQCHHGNGTCDCRSGVIGQKCDSLAPNRFLVTGLTLAEARKLPINGDFAFWVKINPDEYQNVSEVTFDLIFARANIDIPLPEPPLCDGSQPHVTHGSILFHELPITRDTESGQYYIQVISSLCWSLDRVYIPYQLMLNTKVQPPENVIASPLPSARALLGQPPDVEEEGLEECFPVPPPSSVHEVSERCRAIALSVTALQSDGTLVCACDPLGSLSTSCEELNGQCPCAPGVGGRVCDTCLSGFSELTADGCQGCECDPVGSLSSECNATTGQCDCIEGFDGLRCDRCTPDLYFSAADSKCVPCDCNEVGSTTTRCESDGRCVCQPGVRGLQCDECRPDHFNFSSTGCVPCNCYPAGSVRDDGACHSEGGKCECVEGVTGRRCDACPASSVGPSVNTVVPCIDCFCNGYSQYCRPEAGWYQAEVVSGFAGGMVGGFRSNGNIIINKLGCLEINPGTRRTLSISLPKEFLGDKRTSYSQQLTFDLGIQNMVPGDSCHVFVEVVGRLSRYRQITLVAELPCPEIVPQLLQLPLAPGEGVQVDLWFWKRLASQRDIRQILANIRQIRLKIIFDRDTTPQTANLCGVSLGYATNNNSDPFTTFPLSSVSYVEQCDCPPNRGGPRCENCTPGYTTDPSFGGEFARCVRCFCNFHSRSCDPISGECFNCSDNTMGPDCEFCLPGYFRNTSLRTDVCMECGCSETGTVGGACNPDTGVCECREGFTGMRCDQCSMEYWSPSPGQCIPCDCDNEGSLSPACNQSTGVCSCLPSVAGDKCDHCRQNSTDFFPFCEACDECTGQWQSQINPLRTDVEATLELIRVTTANVEPEEVPLLSMLLALLEEVRVTLSASRIDPDLVNNVTELHRRLCELTNRTRDLFDRAVTVSNEIERLDSGFDAFEDETSRLASLLLQLRIELEELAEEFGNLTVPDVNHEFYLAIAQQAEERSNRADELVTGDVTNLIFLAEGILANYNQELVSSFEQHLENLRLLSDLSQRVSEYEAFLAEASTKLCGTLNNTNNSSICSECGGLQCDTCGGPLCNSLVTTADESVNVSTQALEIAESVRVQILSQLTELRTLFNEILTQQNETTEAATDASELHSRATELRQRVQDLLANLRQQLEEDRINPDDIEEIERATLSLQLNLNETEFLGLLVEINATVDAIFRQFGINSTDFTSRAERALIRAQDANALAIQTAANASELETRLRDLMEQERTIRNEVTLSEDTNQDTVVVVTETTASLNDTSDTLTLTQERLNNLSIRLDQLQALIQQNVAALATVRTLTEQAENASREVEVSSLELESSYAQLRNATDEKIGTSQEQLREAQSYRDRTAALIERTSRQLLLEESLERTRAALVTEQEEIRGDVQRLSLQLEELNELVQVHIARNTACLDSGSLQKR